MASGGKLQAPRGTFDVLPDDGRRRAKLRALCEELFEPAGYGFIDTPIFEATELFARGVGETTDIVQKEMFTFEDQGGRSLTLRPEGTAGVCRAYLEHGMHKLPQPVKLWYWGPFFRHEAPQAGRFRQFNQVGIEAIGSDDPSLDAETILLLFELLEKVGAKGVRLRLGSLGTPETRRAYSDELRDYLRAREDELSDEVRGRLDANPLRAFDADHPGTQAVVKDAPKLLDRLNDEDKQHFAEVRALLDDAGREYEIDDGLVRGIDYYTRTVFEFTSDALGAQSGVGGGGRYDGLIEMLGGQHTPGVGWAAGIERILLVSDGFDAPEQPPDVYVVRDGDATTRDAAAVLRAVREAGFSAQMEQAGRSLKGQLKQADRLSARAIVIVGGDGMPVKDMASGEQTETPDLSSALDKLKEVLA
ncbi:MAG TPA: histidine--tRNA ligase [Thermoleophilaceae bacterium]